MPSTSSAGPRRPTRACDAHYHLGARLVKPAELAAVIAFYLSDESGMLTGNVLDYDQSVQGAGDAPKPSPEETPS